MTTALGWLTLRSMRGVGIAALVIAAVIVLLVVAYVVVIVAENPTY